MAEIEKFSLSKWFSGFLNPVSWAKEIKTIVIILLVIFVGFTLYRAYIQPRNVQRQQPNITVQSGGSGTFTFAQTQAPKERRWFMGPTVSIGKDNTYTVGIILLRSF